MFAKILTLIIPFSLLFYSCNPNTLEDIVEKENTEKGEDIEKKTNSKDTWDWTKPESYDFAYSMIGGKKHLSSPFHTTASADSRLTDIIMARDYLPEQGWVLLAKVFGTPDNYIQSKYPYFMLYNKYLGIIRLYILNGDETTYQKAALSLSWLYGTNKNALFSPSEVYRYANEEYHSGNKTSGTIVNYIKEYHSGAWFITGISVNYDPNINYNENLTLRFRIANKTASIVNLDSEFEFETKTETRPITTNSEEADSESKVYKFLDKGHKVLSATSSEKIENYYNKVNTALDPGKFKGHERLQKVTENVKKVLNGKDFKNPLHAIGAISTVLGGPIGAGLGILSSFLGKPNSMATGPVELMPMISVGRGNGVGTIKGNIVFDTNATAFPLQLPGANHTYKKDSAINIDGLPIYDKPLGVISLDRTPYIHNNNTSLHGTSSNKCSGFWCEGEYPMTTICNCISTEHESTEFRYHQYTIYGDDVNILLNPYSDTEIITIKARLLSKHNFPYTTRESIYETFFITDKIEKGKYELIENDKDWFIYGTPFVDLPDLIKQSLLVYDGYYENKWIYHLDDRKEQTVKDISYKQHSDVYLQLLIALKPKDLTVDQTPIIHNITYHLDKTKIQ